MPLAPRRRRPDLAVLLALSALILVLATVVLMLRDLSERRRLERHLRFRDAQDEEAFFTEAATYAALRRHVLDSYVDPVEPQEFLLDALDGGVRALDAHSRLIRAEDQAALEEQARGERYGIGVDIDRAAPALTVFFPLEGSPADLAGVRPGDRILEIDGAEIEASDHEFGIELLTGRQQSPVLLRVANAEEPNAPLRSIEAWRQPVPEPSVRHARPMLATQEVGYLALAAFTPNTPLELIHGIEALERSGSASFILDLRQNSGGSYDAAVDCARLFVPEGVIVSERRRGLETAIVRAEPGKARFAGRPLAILVDRGTASAAEILAGALQDHGLAVLIGERTYGKGVVQSTQPMRGLDFHVRLTTQYYFTPLGRNFENRGAGTHGGGLVPDLLVPSENASIARVHEWMRSLDVPERHREAVARYAARTGRHPLDDAWLARDQLVLAALDLLTGKPPRAFKLPG